MTDNIIIPAGDSSKLLLVSAGGNAGFPFGKEFCGYSVLTDNDFSCRMTLSDNASAEILVLILPGADSRMDFRIDMAGAGADFRFGGLYLCPDRESPMINAEVVHKMRGCSSRQMLKGIVSGNAKVRFHGKITVAPDAQKTEAYQENHSLLLSDNAIVDTSPQLEIYADDVKCSHGAAIGKLDENEQFYMRSRGIPEQEAKVLQMISFISPVMEFLPECDERAAMSEYLEQTIRTAF